jgi:hypothetical protein
MYAMHSSRFASGEIALKPIRNDNHVLLSFTVTHPLLQQRTQAVHRSGHDERGRRLVDKRGGGREDDG